MLKLLFEVIRRCYSARIAQLAEQDTLNVKVPSSILGAGTKFCTSLIMTKFGPEEAMVL